MSNYIQFSDDFLKPLSMIVEFQNPIHDHKTEYYVVLNSSPLGSANQVVKNDARNERGGFRRIDLQPNEQVSFIWRPND